MDVVQILFMSAVLLLAAVAIIFRNSIKVRLLCVVALLYFGFAPFGILPRSAAENVLHKNAGHLSEDFENGVLATRKSMEQKLPLFFVPLAALTLLAIVPARKKPCEPKE